MSEPITEHRKEFGLIDVIEAFTAMRQEFRQQSNEDRSLAKSLDQSTQKVEEFQQQVAGALESIESIIADQTTDETTRRLAESLAEVDHCVSHVIARVREQASVVNRTEIEESLHLFRRSIQSKTEALAKQQGFLARLFSGAMEKRVTEMVDEEVASVNDRLQQTISQIASQDATLQGLSMLADRVTKLTEASGVSKVETLGHSFDGGVMNAIASVPADSESGGHESVGRVVEQLSPAYLYAGKVLRYAEVKVGV